MSGRLILGLSFLIGTATAAPADILWGVNGHPITAYPGIGVAEQLDLLEELGAHSYRVNIAYADDAPKLAALVNEAKPRGVEILPVLTPDVDLDGDTSDALYDMAHQLAVALGSRFKDDIRVWELGNEMDNYAIIRPCELRDDGTEYPCEWGPAGGTDADDYYGPRWAKVSAVLRGLSDGMSAVDPGIRKAMGTAGWGHTGAFERMQQDGIDWDISVWHMYGQDPEPAFAKLSEFGRPIWVTEFNHPEGSTGGETVQAEGLARTMNRLRALQNQYDVEAAHIYELLDEPYWGSGFESVMGLVGVVAGADGGWQLGEPKPAFLSVQETISAVPQRSCDLADAEKIEPLGVRQAGYAACLLLGDAADSDESQRWAVRLDAGQASVFDMLEAMLRSEDFRRHFATEDMSDRDYVAFLYMLLLGREADQYGLDSYAKQLAAGSMTRDGVALSALRSDEFAANHPALFDGDAPGGASGSAAAREVKRTCDARQAAASAGALSVRRAGYAYCMLMGHAADEKALHEWTTALDGGEDVDDLIVGMLESDDFRGRFATDSMTDRDYVALLYRVLLDRDADQYGLDSYTAQMANGSMSREGFAQGAIQSDEFRSKHAALFE